MRSPFWSLVRLYFGSTYGLKPLSEYRRARDWLKLAGAVLLGLLVAADFGAIFVMSAIGQYAALKPLGLESLLFLNAATMVAMIVFAFGFIMALSTYSLSPAEGSLLALPMATRSILAAKFIVVYVSELVFSVFLVGINLVVFGIRESPAPDFYLRGLVVALAIPLLPLSLAYLLIVPLMSLARFMRNKNSVMVVAGVVGIAFALAFNIWIQGSMASLADPAGMREGVAGPGSLINRVGSAWPPSRLAWLALAPGSGTASMVLATLGLAVLGAAVSALLVLALGTAYGRSLRDFGEGDFRRLGRDETATFIGSRFSRRSAFTSLLLREHRMLNREPLYLLNGPFIVVLMPLILAVMYFAQREAFSSLAGTIGGLGTSPAGLLAAAGLGGFLGSSTSIACTALSRDAKALPWLRSLPIPVHRYLLAKLAHALVYAVLGSLVGAVGAGLLLGLPPASILGAAFVALAFAALLNLAGLWIDTANPRLSWDNPVAAMKQNPNAIVAILGAMGLIGILGALSTVLPLGPGGFVLAYGGGSALLFAVLLSLYPRFAARRLAGLET